LCIKANLYAIYLIAITLHLWVVDVYDDDDDNDNDNDDNDGV